MRADFLHDALRSVKVTEASGLRAQDAIRPSSYPNRTTICAAITGKLARRYFLTVTDWGVVNTSFVDAQTSQLRSFQHFLNDVYWSGTEYAPNPGNAWYFDANSGSQFAGGENTGFYAWAVRPGDVAAAPPSIPEPGSLALVGLGLVVLGFAQRRG